MPAEYQEWLSKVQAALASINMPFDEWQRRWHFDFASAHRSGIAANAAAERANRFWWHEQNKALQQQCRH